VDRLTTILLPPKEQDPPADARALARFELTRLSQRLDAASASSGALDLETRAHFAEAKAKIDQALQASITVSK
jgi:hypothetical protein